MILTYNEQANIGATLDRLRWAKKIVVVDSFSTDETVEIVQRFENTELHQREFDHFADQCNFGLQKIDTCWVLSLDADYVCEEGLSDEIAAMADDACVGYQAKFVYCIFGRPLRATLYPPRTVLYRRDSAVYQRDGHAHRVSVTGEIGMLATRIRHDDCKPLQAWLAAQGRYARDEAEKLLRGKELGWKDRLRLWYWPAPLLTLLYCLLVRMLILDGRAGLYYTFQRVYAETLLAIQLLDLRLRARQSDEPAVVSWNVESMSKKQ